MGRKLSMVGKSSSSFVVFDKMRQNTSFFKLFELNSALNLCLQLFNLLIVVTFMNNLSVSNQHFLFVFEPFVKAFFPAYRGIFIHILNFLFILLSYSECYV